MSQRRFAPKPVRRPDVPWPVVDIKPEDKTGKYSPPEVETDDETSSEHEVEQPTDKEPTVAEPSEHPDTDATPPTEPVDAPDPVEETSFIAKPINFTALHEYESVQITLTEDDKMSYIVQLQADASQDDRQAHMQKVKDLCHNGDRQLVGIEAVLEKTIVGYVGVFDDAVLREIWKDKPRVVHSIVQNQAAEMYGDTLTTTTMNWGASRISIDSDTPWSLRPDENGFWPYRKSSAEKEGDGTMLFLIDQGPFCPDDFQRPGHLISTHYDVDEENDSHATMMANVMGGETFGLAPQAKMWVFNNPVTLSKVSVLLAFELIAQIDFDANGIKESGGILCLPFGFPNTRSSNHPLATALDYLMEVKKLKVVTAAPNRHKYVAEFDSFPQNVEELILVGGSGEHNKLASSSDWSEKISLYAPAVEIPIRSPIVHVDATSLDPGRPYLKKRVGYGNCFGAAHVCGVISLILSDDETTPTQAEMKAALMEHFSNITEYAGPTKVPIRVLKKFIQVHHPKRRGVSLPGSRAPSEAHKIGVGSVGTLTIRQSSSGGFHVILAGIHERVSTKLSAIKLADLLNSLQPEEPDYQEIALILEKGFRHPGLDIEAIFGEIKKVEVSFSWDIKSPKLMLHGTERERVKSAVWNAIQLDSLSIQTTETSN